ncbi:MAG TPA: hypothetical protein VF399_08365 [bacterium]
MAKYLWRIVFALLVIYLLFYVVNSILIIVYPYQISYPEGFLLNQAFTIAQGRPIYNGITDYPFLVANYPPVYPYLCGLFVKLFGVSFAWGRIISFLAIIACAYFIYDICRNAPLTLSPLRDTNHYPPHPNPPPTGTPNIMKDPFPRCPQGGRKKEGVQCCHDERGMEINTNGHRQRASLITSLLFLASPYVYNITTQVRVDALALFLSIFGIWFALKNINKKIMYLSALFFAAALFTKQTYAAAPIAFAVYLFFINRTRGFLFIVMTLLSYSVVFLVFNTLTAGELYRNNVLYNANPYSFLFAIKMYASLLKTHLILITLSIAYMIFSPVKKHILSFFSIYFIVAALVALSIGKIGSNVNYFLELIAAGSIVVGLCANELMENTKTQLILPALLIAQLILFAHLPFITGKTPSKIDRETGQRISTMIQAAPGDIISEDAGILILNNRKVLYQPFEFTQLKNQGLWDQSRFVRDIDIQKFSLLILGSDTQGSYDEERFTPEIVAAIANSYMLKEKIGDWYIYKPIKNE